MYIDEGTNKHIQIKKIKTRELFSFSGRFEPICSRESGQTNPETSLLQLQHAGGPRPQQARHDPEESEGLRSGKFILDKLILI